MGGGFRAGRNARRGPSGECLKKLGLPLRRFKTGTPPRVNARTVDFDEMEVQTGDELPVPFSYSTPDPPVNQAVCYLTWTTDETKRIVQENLDRNFMYSGLIEGVGPRYCPSFETKIVRFPDKRRHQLFVEPMGLHTEELYIQGFSSSMPEEVQLQMLHSVPGLRRAAITRPAYAIEYDCIDPLALTPALEVKALPGLYGAGQFNGSSGYEEAAVQGFMAGVNAVRKLKDLPPFVLSRAESYIGTLIDDLVTKGTNEPYRMMTSRSEYRLLLRQDNADFRLTRRGYEIGLVPEERLKAVEEKYDAVQREIKRLTHTGASPSPRLTEFLASKDTADAPGGAPWPLCSGGPGFITANWPPSTRTGLICPPVSLNRWKSPSNTRAISGGRRNRWRTSGVWNGTGCLLIWTTSPFRACVWKPGKSSTPCAPPTWDRLPESPASLPQTWPL